MKQEENARHSAPVGNQPIIIKTYKGTQAQATALFRADAAKMSNLGYLPATQNWAPGQWGVGHFIIALLFITVVIGFIVFVYMLIVKPPGTLTVTYARQAAPAEEKTCPKCAERVKAAASVCRFCGHEFAPGEGPLMRVSLTLLMEAFADDLT